MSQRLISFAREYSWCTLFPDLEKKKKKDRVGVILFRSAHHLLKKINKPIGSLTPFFLPRLTPFIQGLCTVTQTWLFLSIYYFPTILVWKHEWVIRGSFQFRDLDKYAPVSGSRRPTLWDGIINIQLQAERNICIVSEMLERLGNTVLEIWLRKLFSGIITPCKKPSPSVYSCKSWTDVTLMCPVPQSV